MKSIIFDHEDFEKDLLEVLKKYGFGTYFVTKLKIKCKLDTIPVVKIVYGKQYRSLRTKTKTILRKLKIIK